MGRLAGGEGRQEPDVGLTGNAGPSGQPQAAGGGDSKSESTNTKTKRVAPVLTSVSGGLEESGNVRAGGRCDLSRKVSAEVKHRALRR